MTDFFVFVFVCDFWTFQVVRRSLGFHLLIRDIKSFRLLRPSGIHSLPAGACQEFHLNSLFMFMTSNRPPNSYACCAEHYQQYNIYIWFPSKHIRICITAIIHRHSIVEAHQSENFERGDRSQQRWFISPPEIYGINIKAVTINLSCRWKYQFMNTKQTVETQTLCTCSGVLPVEKSAF